MAVLETTRTINNVIVIDQDGKEQNIASPGAVAGGYQNFLICCEMFLGTVPNDPLFAKVALWV